MKCSATTSRNRRCRNDATHGEFCRAHAPVEAVEEMEVEEDAVEDAAEEEAVEEAAVEEAVEEAVEDAEEAVEGVVPPPVGTEISADLHNRLKDAISTFAAENPGAKLQDLHRAVGKVWRDHFRKRPITAFALYMRQEMPVFARAHPTMRQAERVQALAALWRARRNAA